VYVPIASTATQGDVVFTPIYDATSQAPASEQAAMNVKNSITSPVWKEVSIDLDVAAMNSGIARKWIRTTSVSAVGNDLKTFDFAQFYVSTNNCVNTNAVGKLFVEYTFEFFDQVTDKGQPPTVVQNISVWQDTAADSAAFGTVGAVGTYTVGASQNCTPVASAAMGITNPAIGQYLFSNPGVYKCNLTTSMYDAGTAVYTYKADFTLNGVLAANDTTGRLISKASFAQNIPGLSQLNEDADCILIAQPGDILRCTWRLTTLASGTPAAQYPGLGWTNPYFTAGQQFTVEQAA